MKRIIGLAALGLSLTACMTTKPAPTDFDLKIANARIVDGTGAPWFRSDIGVRGDTIAAIGNLGRRSATTVIDAGDRVVSPGFIDLLGWSHQSALADSSLEGKVRQGVTTEATGEGTSPGPYSEAMVRERSTDPSQPPTTWRTLGDFMKVLETNGTALNFAFFVGATNPRSMVIGSINRDPTEDEMKQMEAIIDGAMREGAIGISTSLIYVPATFAKTEELVRLAKVAAAYGGVYFSHIRSEGDEMDAALEEAFLIGREAGMPVNIWHMKITGSNNWGRMPLVIERIENARRSGLDVAANVYPYIASSTSLSSRLRDWSLEGGYAELRNRLKDPALRARIRAEMQETLDLRGGPSSVLITSISGSDYDQFEKKKLDEIASMMGIEPVDAMLTLLEQSPASPAAIFFSMREDDLRTALAVPWVSVGADSGSVSPKNRSGGAHPRAYGTFPRVIGHYVRDVHLFSLEEAVRKITSQAASRINVRDRGIIRPGMKADLVVFDPDTVRDPATFEDPHQFSEGISDVIVNGVPVLRDGAMTTARPGRVLRGSGYVPVKTGS